MNELKKSYNQVKISEYPVNDLKSIIENSAYEDATLKGIKDENLPGGFVLDDISEMILKMFWHLTPEEIVSALKMDRFGYFKEKSKHYQFYGTEYVAEILNKYCKWKQEKAIEHNLSRKEPSHQVEFKIDEEKIHQEYLEAILKEIKSFKNYRHIECYILLKDVPNQFKPSENQYNLLFEQESNYLKLQNEKKVKDEKDSLRVKYLIKNQNQNFKVLVEQRVCNIIVCNWLYKTNIKTN